MSAHVHNDSEACCTLPPVTHEYEPQGKYTSFGTFDKAYVTGPEGTGKAIVVVYDIFGYYPQTLQGADRIAQGANARVIMPDFWLGRPMDLNLYPPKNDEDKAKIQAFFGDQANLATTVPMVESALDEARKLEGVKKVGLLGYCYGAKIAITAAASGKADAVAQNHPAALAVEDFEKLPVPIALNPSQDEDKALCEQIWEVVQKKPFGAQSTYKYYGTVIHGWSAARSDLKDEEVKAQFGDVYDRLIAFFNATLAA